MRQKITARDETFPAFRPSRFRGKTPCLARHAAPRCGTSSRTAVPFSNLKKISGQARDDAKSKAFCRRMWRDVRFLPRTMPEDAASPAKKDCLSCLDGVLGPSGEACAQNLKRPWGRHASARGHNKRWWRGGDRQGCVLCRRATRRRNCFRKFVLFTTPWRKSSRRPQNEGARSQNLERVRDGAPPSAIKKARPRKPGPKRTRDSPVCSKSTPSGQSPGMPGWFYLPFPGSTKRL